jgi:hypothetical protein
MEQQHLVQKYIFDVGFDSEENAYQFQNQIAAFVRDRLVSLTDEIFSEVSEGKQISISKLTLDLGEVSYSDFEGEALQRLKDRLKDKLLLLLSGYPSDDPDEIVQFIVEEKSDLANVEHFLDNGVLPWAARKTKEEYSVSKIILKLIRQNPESIRKLISKQIEISSGLTRLVRQLDDATLVALLKLWLSSDINAFQIYIKNLLEVYKSKSILKNSFAEYREVIWKFLLNEVIINKTVNFKPAALTQNFFEYVSKQEKVNHDQLVLAFFSSLVQSSDLNAVKKEAIMATEELAKSLAVLTWEIIERKAELKKEAEIRFDQNSKVSISNEIELTTKENEESTQQFSEAKKAAEEERRKSFEKQRLERLENYLVRFFQAFPFIDPKDKEVLRKRLALVEPVIQELVNENDVAVLRIFTQAGIQLKDFKTQGFIQLFSESVQSLILQKVFKIDIEAFNTLSKQTKQAIVVSFLQTGYFPYGSLSSNLTKQEINNLFVEAFKTPQDREELNRIIEQYFLKPAKDLNFKIEQARKYLYYKTIEKFFSFFPEILAIYKSDPVGQWLLEDEMELKSFDSLIHFINYYFENKPALKRWEDTIPKLIGRLYHEYKEKFIELVVNLKEKDQKNIIKLSGTDLGIRINRDIESAKAETKKFLMSRFVDVRQEDGMEGESTTEKLKKAIQESNQDPAYTFQKIDSGEPQYISNAGLVIFHPYLTRFFKMLNLVEKRDFKDVASAHKAVYLLQYLVNKSIDVEEHELILNKIMCGIDINEPLLRGIEITEEEKETCESLIQGVIQNWTILKKSTNENFRASFLLRDGRLVLEPKGWKLKVEERGYDILVEKIPWSISTVMLPWMKKVIYVEWK